MYKKSAAPQMNSISAQIVRYTQRNLHPVYVRLLEARLFFALLFKFILGNGKNNLHTRAQINKIKWIA